MGKLIKLVIDTNRYAGDFEREMCAYVTGQIGECLVGEEYVTSFVNTIAHIDWWNKHIVQRAKDKRGLGTKRPVSSYPNEITGHNTSLVIFVDKEPPEDVLIEFSERINEYCKYHKVLYAQIKNSQLEEDRATFVGFDIQPVILTPEEMTDTTFLVDRIRILSGVNNEQLISEMCFSM